MLLELMKVNVRQFDEENEVDETQEEDFSKYIGEDGELDVNSLVSDYAKSNQQEETEENIQEQSEELEENDNEEQEETNETNNEETNETDVGESEEKDNQQEKPQKKTPDQAFAEMRRQLEQSQPLAQWVQDLAKQQGFSDPKELMEAVNRERLEREAKEKGVPVELYERLTQLEEETKRKDDELFAREFNAEVDKVVKENNLNDDQINQVFKYMGEHGYINEEGRATIPFEDAYFLANRDTILKQREEQARQDYLEQMKKLQEQAPPNTKGSTSDKPGGEELDYSKEGIFKKLEQMGIPID